MEKEQYELMYRLEETHWWYRGLRSLILGEIRRRFRGRKDISILDAGCGTGYNHKCFSQIGKAFGIDISDMALEYCARRGLKDVSQSSVTNLPFADGLFDIVVSADVLYHSAVEDDERAINEMKRVLKPGGILIVNVPAFEHLKRPHDKAVHTGRRYTARQLKHKMKACGLEPLKVSYRCAFVYPAALASALLGKIRREDERQRVSDLRKLPRLVNGILALAAAIDGRIVRNIGLPFGTSVFCVARKAGY